MVPYGIALIDITESFCNQIMELQELNGYQTDFKSGTRFGQNDIEEKNHRYENKWICRIKLPSLETCETKTSRVAQNKF